MTDWTARALAFEVEANKARDARLIWGRIEFREAEGYAKATEIANLGAAELCRHYAGERERAS